MKPNKLENPEKLFPLFISDKLAETKRYYVDKLGFAASIDQPEYLQLRYGEGPRAPELCFMRPDAVPDAPPRPNFAGDGVIVSIPTADADRAHVYMHERGARIEQPPSDKPWGWRSFMVRDPNGVVLDFFHVYKQMRGGSPPCHAKGRPTLSDRARDAPAALHHGGPARRTARGRGADDLPRHPRPRPFRRGDHR